MNALTRIATDAAHKHPQGRKRKRRICTDEENEKVRAARETLKELQMEIGEVCQPGKVYLMQMAGTRFFKIGHSQDPKQRVLQLQTGNPLLELVEREGEPAESKEVMDSKSAEDAAHEEFARYGGPERHGGRTLAEVQTFLSPEKIAKAATEWFWFDQRTEEYAVRFLRRIDPDDYRPASEDEEADET